MKTVRCFAVVAASALVACGGTPSENDGANDDQALSANACSSTRTSASLPIAAPLRVTAVAAANGVAIVSTSVPSNVNTPSVHFLSKSGDVKTFSLPGSTGFTRATPLENGLVAVPDYEGTVHFLKTDGTEAAKFKVGERIEGDQTAVGSDTIVVGGGDAVLHYVRSDGTEVQKIKLDSSSAGANVWFRSAVTLDANTVVVSSNEPASLYFLDARGALKKRVDLPVFSGQPALAKLRDGTLVAGLDPGGKQGDPPGVFLFDRDGNQLAKLPFRGAPIVRHDDSIVVRKNDGVVVVDKAGHEKGTLPYGGPIVPALLDLNDDTLVADWYNVKLETHQFYSLTPKLEVRASRELTGTPSAAIDGTSFASVEPITNAVRIETCMP